MSSTPTVLAEKRDTYAIVTLNRPEKLNALNSKTVQLLGNIMKDMNADSAIRAVIVTGAGPKAFVAGADIQEISALEGKGGDFSAAGQQVFRAIEKMDKPVIAAVNGFALGGGCELALSCHIRIASDNAKFGLPEITLGVIPGYGGTQRLPRLIGKAQALQLMLTGEMVTAEKAASLGLVNEVLTAEDLMPRAEKMASKIASLAPVAAKLILESVTKGLETDLDNALAIEATNFGAACATEDAKIGTSAFLEKRKPEFTGK
ncbi:MAG: enoyl-CoA hydratase/isomerase family protein [Calditrichia bacterium]